jgi:hypothetical protein
VGSSLPTGGTCLARDGQMDARQKHQRSPTSRIVRLSFSIEYLSLLNTQAIYLGEYGITHRLD